MESLPLVTSGGNNRLIDVLDAMRWIAKYGNVIHISVEYKYGNNGMTLFFFISLDFMYA